MFGSLFGGFIAQHAFELAELTAFAFNGKIPVFLGFDEVSSSPQSQDLNGNSRSVARAEH